MIRIKIAIFFGKTVSLICRKLGLGAGVTWAGEVALKIGGMRVIREIWGSKEPKETVLIAGTNGKTTTTKLLVTALRNAGKKVVTNESGANLLNGIVGSLITQPAGEFYVLEVDENNLIRVMREMGGMREMTIVLLNLFRDQLDRYGEVDKIAKDWEKLGEMGGMREMIINGDDPQLAYLGEKLKKNVFYFGLENKKFLLGEKPHATDSIFCPKCGGRLNYQGYYLSHLGEYRCGECGLKHPKNNEGNKGNEGDGRIEGVYNIYNTLAAKLTAKVLGIKKPDFSGFKPAFGRGEEICGVKILLSKNPAGFNESLRTVIDSKEKGPLLLVLNDRIPDGRDVSWIWDTDFELLQNYKYPIHVSGDRKEDLMVRLKYAEIRNIRVIRDIREIIKKTKWVLATYSGMLEVRKMLTGKKIL